MEIGIIGKGKMGRDILNHLFQFDNKIILICRRLEDVEKSTDLIEKQLKKMLNRGYLTEDEYEKKKQSFRVSNKLSDLKNCNLVIESIIEDKQIKQDIFKEIELVVNPECILATNTSSIPLNIVFEKCDKKSRCLGTHFFYPVKVTKTVEINKATFTEQKYVEIVKDFFIKVNKEPLELEEKANMILSKILLNLISQVYIIYEEKYLTIEDIDKVLKENFITFGLFEIIDSTGINIILESIENFIDERYKNLYNPFYVKGKEMIEKGYIGGNGNKGLIDYECNIQLKEADEEKVNDFRRNIVLRLQSLLINELAFLITNQYVEKDKISEAVQEILGLSENPIDMLNRIGKQKISDSLLQSYQRSQDNIYKPLDLDVFNN